MKHVKINSNQAGLVFKNDAYQRVITEGSYWFWRSEYVQVYELTHAFRPPVELNILLQDAQLAAMLHVVEVKDTEIVLQYENGLLKQVLTPGRYTFWKSVIAYEFVTVNLAENEIPARFDKELLHNRLLTPYVRAHTVESYEKAVLFVNGKFERVLESGIYYWWKNATITTIGKVDTRQQQLEVNGQEILTRDKAALRVNAWAQYKVADIEKALLRNKEYEKQLYVAFQLALREFIAGYGFDELLGKKDTLAPFVVQQVQEKAAALGIEVYGFGIRDIILPGDVKEIMNHVLVAEKKAQANTIMRREETASTRSLLNTAKLMEENAMLWKLKEMEYVEKIAEKISNISVSGNGAILEQLKQLFVTQK